MSDQHGKVNYPEPAPAKRAIDRAARFIRAAWSDHATYPCSDFNRYLDWSRCSKWSCRGCRAFLIDRELASARAHFENAADLFLTTATAGSWSALAKSIYRTGGEYLRMRDTGCWTVFTTAAIAGTTPITATDALDGLAGQLDQWHGTSRPITTSHGFSLPRLVEMPSCQPSTLQIGGVA